MLGNSFLPPILYAWNDAKVYLFHLFSFCFLSLFFFVSNNAWCVCYLLSVLSHAFVKLYDDSSTLISFNDVFETKEANWSKWNVSKKLELWHLNGDTKLNMSSSYVFVSNEFHLAHRETGKFKRFHHPNLELEDTSIFIEFQSKVVEP